MTRVLLRHVGLVFFVSTVVSAQPPPPPPGMFIGMPAGAQSVPLPQMPPRDNSQPAKPGTATLRGHVVAELNAHLQALDPPQRGVLVLDVDGHVRVDRP